MKKKKQEIPFRVGNMYIYPEGPEMMKYFDEIKKEVDEELLKQGAAQECHGRVLVPLESIELRQKIQKRILKEKYGIDWQTPYEKSKNTKFD